MRLEYRAPWPIYVFIAGVVCAAVLALTAIFSRGEFPLWISAVVLLLSAANLLYFLWKPSKRRELTDEQPDIFKDAFASFTDDVRFRHTFIVAPSGAGKTNLLQHYLERDFDRVARRKCSVVIVDATGDLLNEVTRLDRFSGEDTPLVLADVGDTRFPLALSLFDFGLDKVSEENRDAVRATSKALLNYLFGSLMGVEMTGLQVPALSFALEVLIERPHSNLSDLKAFLQPGGWHEYVDIIDRLRPEVGDYFRQTDKSKEDRRAEVIRRIDTLLADPILSNMCNARETKLDLFAAMNRPSVTFINLPRKLLQDSLETFGRYFLARIILAAERRVDIPENRRFPCFLYLDEAQHVLKRDEKISDFMDGVRKYRVGGTFLTQGVGEFEHRPLDAILRNVNTIFATDLRDGTDARFARFMGTNAEFISGQPSRHFALRSEKYRKAVSIPVPRAGLFDEPRMSNEQYQALRDTMRERYATPVEVLYGRPEQAREVEVQILPPPTSSRQAPPPERPRPKRLGPPAQPKRPERY